MPGAEAIGYSAGSGAHADHLTWSYPRRRCIQLRHQRKQIVNVVTHRSE